MFSSFSPTRLTFKTEQFKTKTTYNVIINVCINHTKFYLNEKNNKPKVIS